MLDVGVDYKEDVDEVMRVARSVLEEFYADPEWRQRLAAEGIEIPFPQRTLQVREASREALTTR